MKKYNLKIMIIFFLLVYIISIIYISCYFANKYINKKENEKIINSVKEMQIDKKEITDKRSEQILKIEKLQKENSDIVGWIEIEGTNINYPVLQTTNNEFYLTHNYNKEYSKTGSIFLDKNVELNKPSTNFLIYGHRSIDGEMFEELIKYKKEKYYKAHPTIKFTTVNDESEYEIIAVFLSRVYYKKETDVFRYYYFIDAKNKEEYDYYINNSKKNSLYDTGKIAEYNEQLLTLSTCEYSKKDGRLAIIAKKVLEKKQ